MIIINLRPCEDRWKCFCLLEVKENFDHSLLHLWNEAYLLSKKDYRKILYIIIYIFERLKFPLKIEFSSDNLLLVVLIWAFFVRMLFILSETSESQKLRFVWRSLRSFKIWYIYIYSNRKKYEICGCLLYVSHNCGKNLIHFDEQIYRTLLNKQL